MTAVDWLIGVRAPMTVMGVEPIQAFVYTPAAFLLPIETVQHCMNFQAENLCTDSFKEFFF